MRRILLLAATLITVIGLLAGPAAAYEGDLPAHGHMLLHRPDFVVDYQEDDDFVTITLTFRRCVDLAGSKTDLPLRAHHDTVHTGRASDALWGAGLGVIPTGLSPWKDCADLIANPSFRIPLDEL